MALLRQNEHYRAPSSFAPTHHAVADGQDGAQPLEGFDWPSTSVSAEDLPIAGNSQSTTFYDDAESCDSASSCSEMSWSSFPADVPHDDPNAVLGEIWLKFRSYRRNGGI